VTTIASTHSTILSTAARLRRWGTLLGVALAVILILGSSWDGDWHGRVGRDTFWIPPHLMIYSSITLFGLVALGITAWTTLNVPKDAPGLLRLFGIQAPPGIALMGIGVVVSMMAAPFDDVWHRTFGIDVSIWSPPHFTGWVGFVVSFVGVLIALIQEFTETRADAVFPRFKSPWALIAFAVTAGGLLRIATIATFPGLSYSLSQNDTLLQEVPIFHPFLFALAASVFMVPMIALIYRLAGRRGLIAAVAGLIALAIVSMIFVNIFTPMLREALGHPWRTSADDTGTRDLFLLPALYSILPALVALLFRPERGARTGAIVGFVYWAQLAIYLVSVGRLEIGPAAGGLALCLSLGAATGWIGSRVGAKVIRWTP